jgi:hypothetical protein
LKKEIYQTLIWEIKIILEEFCSSVLNTTALNHFLNKNIIKWLKHKIVKTFFELLPLGKNLTAPNGSFTQLANFKEGNTQHFTSAVEAN